MELRWQDWIVEDPHVLAGKPSFKDTRLSVAYILESLGYGTSEQELLRGHPRLTPEHLRAAQLYAAAMIRLETVLEAT